jgi:hypothetical protein
MKNFLSNNRFKKIIFSLAIFLIVAAGLYFRIGRKDDLALPKTNNITSYYYDISARFNADLIWPQKDIWHFAPGQAVENVPPLLAYATVYSYRIARFFAPNLAFDNWAFSLPVWIFLIWAAAGFFLTKRIFGGLLFPTMFLILLALTPNSSALMKFGHYTEEFLGSFFLFLAFAFFALWQKERRKIFLGSSLISAALLILTWQQFHIIFVIYGLAALIFLIKGKIKDFLDVLILSGGALLLAQILSICFLRSAYLPSQMMYEAYLGLAGYSSGFLKLAMSRTDWGNLTFAKAINYFGIWGSLAWLAGFARLLVDFKKNRENAYLLWANLATAVLMFFFVKSAYVFLPFFLITAAYGGGQLIVMILNLKHEYRKIF